MDLDPPPDDRRTGPVVRPQFKHTGRMAAFSGALFAILGGASSTIVDPLQRAGLSHGWASAIPTIGMLILFFGYFFLITRLVRARSAGPGQGGDRQAAA